MDSTITLHNRGDVVLKLGRNEEAKSDVLVSSAVLSILSPVFEAMFNCGFAESQARSVESPLTVPLPGDDPHAMLLICKIAHFRTADIPQQLSPNELADFAIACNKYQCINSVRPWSQLWVANLLESSTPDLALFIIYVLDLPKEFNNASLILIRDQVNDIKITLATYDQDLLPLTVFDKLLREKRQFEDKIFRALHGMASDLVQCDGMEKTIGNLFASLRKIPAWANGVASIYSLRTSIRGIRVAPNVSCRGYCSDCIKAVDYKSLLMERLNKAYDEVKGLCLDCIKNEVKGTNLACRIAHT